MHRLILSVGIVSLVGVAGALAHEGDVGLKVVSGKITTGIVEDTGSGEVVIPGQRVFLAEMGTVAPGFADEPGHFAEAGAFAQGTGIGFNIRKALRSWNGTDFNAIASTTMRLEDGSGTQVRTTPLSDSLVSGFSFVTVGATGGFDEHLNFFLDTNTPGIYLLELDTWDSQGQFTPTDAYWMVFNNGLSEAEHEAAEEWVEENLVPTPGALGLIGAAGLLGGRRRR